MPKAGFAVLRVGQTWQMISCARQVMMEKVSRITDRELAEEPPGERGESKASIISSV